jgi:hypothetical protein
MSTVVAEISERAACAAWSPVASHPDIVALGTKVRNVAFRSMIYCSCLLPACIVLYYEPFTD